MRLLVVEALCAALISRVPMTVEVESEDGKALDPLLLILSPATFNDPKRLWGSRPLTPQITRR
jgi:hypothetical protein